jgi:hypothetical protein
VPLASGWAAYGPDGVTARSVAHHITEFAKSIKETDSGLIYIAQHVAAACAPRGTGSEPSSASGVSSQPRPPRPPGAPADGSGERSARSVR